MQLSLMKLGVICGTALLMTSAASAGSLFFSGNFTQDDNVVLIPFTIFGTEALTIHSTSFADGSVGFEPVLTLYDGTGALLFQDATGGTVPGSCGVRAIDPVSGYCLDGEIQQTLAAGSYTLALTEYDNIPSGPNLSDGFPQTGNGNFTGPEFLGQPGSFILFDGSQRNNDWAVQIDGVPVPEPGTATLGTSALLALIAVGRKLRRGI